MILQKNTTISRCRYGICDGTGWTLKTENGYEVAAPCKCYEDKKLEAKLEFAKIPKEFEGLTINSFDTNLYTSNSNRQIASIAKKTVAGYVKKFETMQEQGKGLFLYSTKRGSGKTRLTVSCGNALINTYKQRVRFITTLNLLGRIRETYKDDSKISEQQLVNEFCEIPILILDDIGTEKGNAWVTEIFFKILDTRMTYKKVTLITSNLAIEELQHDERIKSRLRKMVILVKMPEEDIRGQIGAKENNDLINMLLS